LRIARNAEVMVVHNDCKIRLRSYCRRRVYNCYCSCVSLRGGASASDRSSWRWQFMVAYRPDKRPDTLCGGGGGVIHQSWRTVRSPLCTSSLPPERSPGTPTRRRHVLVVCVCMCVSNGDQFRSAEVRYVLLWLADCMCKCVSRVVVTIIKPLDESREVVRFTAELASCLNYANG